LWTPATRLPAHTRIQKESEHTYKVTQVICDPEEHNDWFIEAIAQTGPGFVKPEISIEQIGY
ncbi:MAG: hypothetical protein JKY15_06915, partial [Deltaproteobacteria bacterium]|nr:hypothetical protein [Deltaproteobacteria bacterium]